jgi:hypothetical protein
LRAFQQVSQHTRGAAVLKRCRRQRFLVDTPCTRPYNLAAYDR